MLSEVEREPSPRAGDGSSPCKRAATAPACAPTSKSAAPLLLLELAFGKQMLQGRDEWHDVADVIRSSFLVVAKELKRHEKRLRTLEARLQQQADDSARWTLVQTQMQLFSDELQLLTAQLKANDLRAREAATQDLACVQQTMRSADDRLARLQDRVVELEAKVAATELPLVSARATAAKASSKAREKTSRLRASEREAAAHTPRAHNTHDSARVRHEPTARGSDVRYEASGSPLQAPAESSSLQELVALQKQSQGELRRLQLALAAHDHRAMAQANRIEASVRDVARSAYKSTSRGVETRPVDGVAVATSSHVETEDQAAVDVPEHQHIASTAQRAKVRGDTAAPPSRAPLPSHSTLRARYAIARAKQQESLYSLRTQQQR